MAPKTALTPDFVISEGSKMVEHASRGAQHYYNIASQADSAAAVQQGARQVAFVNKAQELRTIGTKIMNTANEKAEVVKVFAGQNSDLDGRVSAATNAIPV